MENFLEYLNNTYMSKNTIKTYFYVTSYFVESYFDKDVKEINRTDVLKYQEHLENKGYKGKTISVYLEGLRAYCKYLYYFEDVITSITNIRNNKAYIDSIPRMTFEPKLNYSLELTTHEVQRLRLKIKEKEDHRTLLIFELMIDTGLRIHEVLKIKKVDILKKEFEIKGKGGKYRHIYPSGHIRTLARNYMKSKQFKEGDYLFIGSKNKVLHQATINTVLKKYTALAKVDKKKVFPHNFRHFFTINEIKKGTPLNVLKTKLGINDTKVLLLYQARKLTNG